MTFAPDEQDMAKDYLEFTQIAVNSFTVWGLDKQGRVWRYSDSKDGWVKLPMMVSTRKSIEIPDPPPADEPL